MSENRDEATGQFAPAEPLTGTAGIEAAQGYVPLPEDKPEEPEALTVEEAAEDLTNSRTAEADVKTYGTFLDGLPENVTLTVEQAAQITTEEKAAEAKSAEEAAAVDLRAQVDERRGVEAEKAIPPETKALIDSGLDPKVAEAFQHPQVREAIEQEFGEANKIRESYSAGLENARVHTLASLAEVVPHLAGLPPQQFEEGLALLSQVDPPAFQQAMNILGRAYTIEQARQQDQQQRETVAQQQFVSHVKAEDARLIDMVGSETAAAEANQALVTYLGQHGIPQNQMLSVVMQNPVLRTAEARQTIWKAAKYDAIQKARPTASAKPLPPVQRPGTSNVVRGSEPSSKIAALEKQLATATGDKAARISAQIYGLERAARG